MKVDQILKLETLIGYIEAALKPHGLMLNSSLDKALIRKSCQLIFGRLYSSAEEKNDRQKVRISEARKIETAVKGLKVSLQDLETSIKGALPDSLATQFKIINLSFGSNFPVHVVDPKQSMLVKIDRENDIETLESQFRATGNELNAEYFNSISMNGITNDDVRVFLSIVGLVTLTSRGDETLNPNRPVMSIEMGATILTEIWEAIFLAEEYRTNIKLFEMSVFFEGLLNPEPEGLEGSHFKRIHGNVRTNCHRALDNVATARRFFHLDIEEPELWLSAMSYLKDPSLIAVWRKYSRLSDMGFGSSDL